MNNVHNISTMTNKSTCMESRAIAAILPLAIRGSYDTDDLARADILFRTLTAFAEPGLFTPFWIISPRQDVEIIRRRVEKWSHLDIQVVSEESLVPELIGHRALRGWRKQQIIKLAAPRIINTDFFITFDADVICLRPLTWNDLIIDGKALMSLTPRDGHKKWWASAARILQAKEIDGDYPGWGMNVTPALLSTHACRQLTESIVISGNGSWADELCSLHNAKNIANLRLKRYLMRKWTEYSLYYLFLLDNNLFHCYHQTAGEKFGGTKSMLSVRDADDYENWNPSLTFSPSAPGLFSTVGSKFDISPSDVWEKIKAFIPDTNVPTESIG